MQVATPPFLHGPTASASQSTFVDWRTRHVPRAAPVVSIAKSVASFPESLIVKRTSGCDVLATNAELSVNFGSARPVVAITAATGVPMESGAAALSLDMARLASL